MSLQSERARKRNLLRRVRRQRLKYITILPSLITLLNGICGFAAIVFASKGVEHMSVRQINLSYFAWSGYMIFFAMIADMLDGRVARISKTTSSFGGQLDSLCDAISFGVAPAFLMLKVLDHKLDETVGPEFTFEGFVYRFVWLAAAAYMACATIRLARFNVENEEDETAHMSFVGLPTPAAAGVLASLIVFYQDLLGKLGDAAWVDYTESVLVGALPFVAIGVAILMIGRIRYPHLVNLYLRGRKPMTHLFWAVVILGMIFLFTLQAALVISFCGFALAGFFRWVAYRIRAMRRGGAEFEPPVLSVTTPETSELPQ
ncbi:MAG TPA: CDP-alcohol phosphatidyltransferase family protein [Anaerohalosphaeraceae bacterium]|jgi:CDP-diacylglycerol--serine O-phosphatidyltransferase|nr:CDP-alcohol phosphatidyltransferase family protein [Anaerohalosphaeraceae bacterium]HRT49746.1 CDP-alcohol phosphatidyltransferase family protein [Anaerohalosphaeraceae bacterium]HRT85594.1 CDP-alcohol phosphatidyltransferase family protein [Anaerohalosphaeraceae bacterium]